MSPKGGALCRAKEVGTVGVAVFLRLLERSLRKLIDGGGINSSLWGGCHGGWVGKNTKKSQRELLLAIDGLDTFVVNTHTR